MICLNLARTKRVLPFLLWNWHRLQIAWSVQCFARIGTMFEFVPMGVPIFGRKCPMFCTNWHDVQVCAFGWQIIWHEVSNILHELARCSSSCLWLARCLARSAQHLAQSCTKNARRRQYAFLLGLFLKNVHFIPTSNHMFRSEEVVKNMKKVAWGGGGLCQRVMSKLQIFSEAKHY